MTCRTCRQFVPAGRSAQARAVAGRVPAWRAVWAVVGVRVRAWRAVWAVVGVRVRAWRAAWAVVAVHEPAWRPVPERAAGAGCAAAAAAVAGSDVVAWLAADVPGLAFGEPRGSRGIRHGTRPGPSGSGPLSVPSGILPGSSFSAGRLSRAGVPRAGAARPRARSAGTQRAPGTRGRGPGRARCRGPRRRARTGAEPRRRCPVRGGSGHQHVRLLVQRLDRECLQCEVERLHQLVPAKERTGGRAEGAQRQLAQSLAVMITQSSYQPGSSSWLRRKRPASASATPAASDCRIRSIRATRSRWSTRTSGGRDSALCSVRSSSGRRGAVARRRSGASRTPARDRAGARAGGRPGCGGPAGRTGSAGRARGPSCGAAAGPGHGARSGIRRAAGSGGRAGALRRPVHVGQHRQRDVHGSSNPLSQR